MFEGVRVHIIAKTSTLKQEISKIAKSGF